MLWNDPNLPFIRTVDAVKPFWHIRAAGGAMMLTGMFLLIFNLYKTATVPGPPATNAQIDNWRKAAAHARKRWRRRRPIRTETPCILILQIALTAVVGIAVLAGLLWTLSRKSPNAPHG